MPDDKCTEPFPDCKLVGKLKKIKCFIEPYEEDCGAVSTREILDDIIEVINA